MKCRIMHFYGHEISIPGAVKCDPPDNKYAPWYEIEINDILDFIQKYGPVVISPPGKDPFADGWFIWITDHTGKFVQK